MFVILHYSDSTSQGVRSPYAELVGRQERQPADRTSPALSVGAGSGPSRDLSPKPRCPLGSSQSLHLLPSAGPAELQYRSQPP